jgi:pilus assembly protein CpaF
MTENPSLGDVPAFAPPPHLNLAGPQTHHEPAEPAQSRATNGHPTAAGVGEWGLGPGSSDPTHVPSQATGPATTPAAFTAAAMDPPGTASGSTRSTATGAVGWAVVRELRRLAAAQLAERLRETDHGTDHQARRGAGQQVVEMLIADRARLRAASGEALYTTDEEQWLTQAVMDALFGLGRLQPLVDNPDVVDIEITGYDQVRLIMTDGQIVRADPVADTDEELIEFLQFVASRGTASGAERPFSRAHKTLEMSLPGRLRLSAAAWILPRPSVRIRRQTVTNTTLGALQRLGSFDARLAAFLDAAVRARKNIVVAGEMGSGKTTLVRALAAAVPEHESIITLESEWELYLNDLPQRQLRPVLPYESHAGTGEYGPDGRRAGAVTLTEIFEGVLRQNADRVIVGEVRGPEALDMFRAMQAGSGSMSTIHSRNARDTAQRLVTCISGSGASADYAWGLVATNIDLIVHVKAQYDPRTQQKHRWISEVLQITSGGGSPLTDSVRPLYSTLFACPRGTRQAELFTQPEPELLADLEDAGLDPSVLGILHERSRS